MVCWRVSRGRWGVGGVLTRGGSRVTQTRSRCHAKGLGIECCCRRARSGKPLTLHESVLELLQAGFHPLNLDRLFGGLERIVTLVLDDSEYIPHSGQGVPRSIHHIRRVTSSVIIFSHLAADPYGILEEGQIHFRSSELITDSESGTQMDTVTASVLVSTSVHRNELY
jgi:hypothetical protein